MKARVGEGRRVETKEEGLVCRTSVQASFLSHSLLLSLDDPHEFIERREYQL